MHVPRDLEAMWESGFIRRYLLGGGSSRVTWLKKGFIGEPCKMILVRLTLKFYLFLYRRLVILSVCLIYDTSALVDKSLVWCALIHSIKNIIIYLKILFVNDYMLCKDTPTPTPHPPPLQLDGVLQCGNIKV